jgi:hypothetical protein
VYEVTAAGRERLAAWVADTSWPRAAPTALHLRLVAVAASRLADPVALIDRQRRELLRELRATQQAQLEEADDSTAAVLLEGAALRLQADLRWLEACTQHWSTAPRRAGRET